MRIINQGVEKENKSAVVDSSPSVPVLDKAIRILYQLANSKGAVTSSSLAREADISQPTCYRILKTLEAADWIKRNEQNGYDFSMGLFPLVRHFVDLELCGRSVQPMLDELSRELGLTAKYSVQLGNEQMTIAVAHPVLPYGASASVGARFPLVWGASGAVLLSCLEEERQQELVNSIAREDWGHERPEDLQKRIELVRKHGVCENLGNHPQGIDTISSPVKSTRIAGAITLVGLRGDINKDNLSTLKQKLIEATDRTAKRLQASA